jgi:hypothetical protein
MIFSAKPVTCRLVIRVDLYADTDSKIPEVIPLYRTEFSASPCRATADIKRHDVRAALEAMLRAVEIQP